MDAVLPVLRGIRAPQKWKINASLILSKHVDQNGFLIPGPCAICREQTNSFHILRLCHVCESHCFYMKLVSSTFLESNTELPPSWYHSVPWVKIYDAVSYGNPTAHVPMLCLFSDIPKPTPFKPGKENPSSSKYEFDRPQHAVIYSINLSHHLTGFIDVGEVFPRDPLEAEIRFLAFGCPSPSYIQVVIGGETQEDRSVLTCELCKVFKLRKDFCDEQWRRRNDPFYKTKCKSCMDASEPRCGKCGEIILESDPNMNPGKWRRKRSRMLYHEKCKVYL